MDTEQIKQLRARCISNATRTLEAAKLLLQKKYHNIAYHLAVLGLEEIGKSVMILIGHGSPHGERGTKILKQAKGDHARKLFWAIWGPTFGTEQMSGKQILSFAELARKIHLTRLRGLYVEPCVEASEPSESVSRKDTERIVSLLETRIEMEKAKEIAEPDEEVKSDLAWFVSAVEDLTKKKLIFGKKSIDKLKELGGSGTKWIHWVRQQFDKAEQENQEMLRKELARQRPSGDEKYKDKWKIRFRLQTTSHSIREPVLREWNSQIQFLRFTLGKKSSRSCELIVDMVLPKQIPMNALWHLGWGQTRLFAISLNIATKGYFWWYLPRDVSRFYERITDLENNAEAVVQRRPALELNWGNNVLSRTDLWNTAMCYRFLPSKNVDFLNAYVTGISFMGKSDLHTPFEKEIYLQFYHALLSAMKYYGDLSEGRSIDQVLDEIFAPPMGDTSALHECVAAAKGLDQTPDSLQKVTLTECGGMKILFDAYVLTKIIDIAEQEAKKPTKV